MKNYGIFYGSTTGTTKDIAQRIARQMNVAPEDVYDVATTAPSTVADYETLILGTSTWGDGELQDNWYDFSAALSAMELGDKKIALFGCGDETMSNTFCNAVGKLYNMLQDTHATFIGAHDVDGYNFSHSDAVNGDMAVGLLLDDVNHPELTDIRIRAWVNNLLL